MKRTPLKKRSGNPTKILKKKADDMFAKYIRLRDKNICYTCGRKYPIMNCGHFRKREFLNTRYDEQNNHCQCQRCNKWHHGELDIYSANLEKQYGYGIVQKLIDKSNVHIKMTSQDYENLIEIYKNKILSLDKRYFL